MKKIFTTILMAAAFACNAQIFWTENFESGVSSGLDVTGYTMGPNGPWTMTVVTTEGDAPNSWYVSCAEAGHLTGGCGTDCATSLGLGATLHIGTDPVAMFGDLGAAYYAGDGLCGVSTCFITDRRAESPTINCTGKAGITLSFYYIENGDLFLDDASVWYSTDNGFSWSLLFNPPKTPPICPGYQGYWDHYTYPLPSSADNNPTVKIGFRWVNNDDMNGSDPSFAVDSVSLSGAPFVTTTVSATFTANHTSVCQDSCVVFTSTSTASGTIDSISWYMVGMSGALPHTNPFNLCFTAPGTYTVSLYAYSGGVGDTTSTTITVNPTPHPAITKTGHTLTAVGPHASYQWVNGATPIAGATNSTFTYTVTGSYSVIVDSAGCKGISSVINTARITAPGAIDNRYWITQPTNATITLRALQPIDEPLDVTVVEATGRLLKKDVWSAGADTKLMDGSELAPGMYMIRISNESHQQTFRWLR